MPDAMTDEEKERLKATLWLSIGQLVDSTTLSLDINATPQFIASLTEMVYAQIENVAQDLENFARHAGRSTVTTEDVLLLCRRNDALREIVREVVEEGKARNRGGGARR